MLECWNLGLVRASEPVLRRKSLTKVSFPVGDVSVGIKCASGVLGPCEADIDFDIIKNDDDTFLVKYTPLAAGRYTIMVLFADEVRLRRSNDDWCF